MKRKLGLLTLAVFLLALGLSFTGCGDGAGSNRAGGGATNINFKEQFIGTWQRINSKSDNTPFEPETIIVITATTIKGNSGPAIKPYDTDSDGPNTGYSLNDKTWLTWILFIGPDENGILEINESIYYTSSGNIEISSIPRGFYKRV